MPRIGFRHSLKSRVKMSAARNKRFGSVEQRFWSKVSNHMKEGCWEWLGDCYTDGYGRFWAYGNNWRAHRFAMMMIHGELAEDVHVLHECDNPKCVRPSHLFLGTYRDNIDDMVRKGRSLFGEKHHHAILTEAQAIETLLWKRGQGTRLMDLAVKFGCSLVALELIRSGTNWKHLYHLHSKFGGNNDGIPSVQGEVEERVRCDYLPWSEQDLFS